MNYPTAKKKSKYHSSEPLTRTLLAGLFGPVSEFGDSYKERQDGHHFYRNTIFIFSIFGIDVLIVSIRKYYIQ